MNFDLIDFQLIINIAETKNLTRAAEKSFLSTPAASNRIKNIEKNLNIKLLERFNQGVELTDVGKIYLKYARSIYHEISCLRGELAEYSASVQGKLDVVANTTAITEYIAPVLSDFLMRYSYVQLNLYEKTSEEIVNLLLERRAEIGIISGDINTQGLQTIPLATSQLVLIAPKHHDVLQIEKLQFADTLAYPFVTLWENNAIQVFLQRIAQQLHQHINTRVRVGSYDAICQMVSAGVGIAIIPLSSFKRLNHIYPNLSYHQLSESWAERVFKICAIDFDNLSQFAKDFVDSLTNKNKRSSNL